MTYNFNSIEQKWQKKWEGKKAFRAVEKKDTKKFYVLEMFPYPSGSGLHMGHALNFTIGDIFARFKRMQGFNVLHPMGYDALGLPAENAAIKDGQHPKIYTKKATTYFTKQMKRLGFSYDWERKVETIDPEYYKWDQWIFLKLFEKGLAYKKRAAVNFCPKCKTVLANEQAQGGKCDRCDSDIQIKHLEQWFFKITDYANELYDKIDTLDDWPSRTKAMQKNWIGKSYGTEILFEIIPKGMTSKEASVQKWPIFTTRPDTIFGVTFMVISAQHPRLMELVTKEQKKDVEKFLKKLKSVSEKESEEMEKQGVFTGAYAINPMTKEKVPVYAGNFVVADYGSGMVMAVPGHDQRDFEFAKKYGLKIKQVIAPIFETKIGEDAIREDKETIERDSVFGIVKHWKDDKYFLLNWKKFGWKSFVIGGVEKGETAKDAIIREVKEETGYYDIKSVKEIGFETHANFFARHKDVNRYGKFRTFLVELKSDKYIQPQKEHIKNHDGEWIDKNKITTYINLDNNKYLWELFLNKESAYTGPGKLINSEAFDGLDNDEAKEHITIALKEKKLGKKVVQFKLRDWLISRQRYWGTPIPIVYCDKCGAVPVPEKDLPIKLPDRVKFGKGNPLTTNEKWIKTKCPKCKGNARRETDTMDTFVNSSWYFLRYCDSKNKKKIFDKDKVKYWCPIDTYVGGKEHACMHLIYFRFYTKFLRDIGLLNFDEPVKRLFHQGVLHGKDGNKMSKSTGTGVDPMDTIKKYGADSLRMFLVSAASPDSDFNWNEKGIEASFKFLNKLFDFSKSIKFGKSSKILESKLNKTIKEISEDFEYMKYNLAIIRLRKLFDYFSEEKQISKKDFEIFLKLLNPFCPHIAEELWHNIGNKTFISLEKWPVCDEKKIDVNLEKQEEAVEQLVTDINNIVKIINSKGQNPTKAFIYVIPKEKEIYFSEINKLNKKTDLEIKIFAVNDKDKYDPKNISGKTKLGKPGIYLE